MTREDVLELAIDIVAPIQELEHYDRDGYAKWKQAVTDRLLKEFGAVVKW